MPESDDIYRTSNLAEVAWLDYRRCDSDDIAIVDGRCVWEFRRTEALRDAVRVFNARKALVEPVKFSQLLAQVKREMIDLRRSQPAA